MPRLPGSMLVTATPVWSLMRVMWYSNGPGVASNCQEQRAPELAPLGGVVGRDLEVRRLTGHRDSSRIDRSAGPWFRRGRHYRPVGPGDSAVPARVTGDAELPSRPSGPQSESPTGMRLSRFP